MAEPTNLSHEQRNHIEKVGHWLLGALDEIAQWADIQLKREQKAEGGPYETTRFAIWQSLAEVRKAAELLLREPAIARIIVQWELPRQDCETLLVCRGSSAGTPEFDGVDLASYRSPLGRLAEFEPGDIAFARIAGEDRKGKIIERQRWTPIHSDELWDATDCVYEVDSWRRFTIASIRRFVEDLQGITTDAPLEAIYARAKEADNVLHERYRKAIDRIALRDQPILDRYQGEVFRMPLDRRVLLLGPPGTGKTTTLIKRIAQKQTLSELPQEELDLVQSANLAERFAASEGWAMFAPTELLTFYLRDAFNREGVPAWGHQLKTWQRERRHIGRDVIPILRTESRGRFRENERPTLQSLTSLSISNMYDSFAEFHLGRLADRCRDAVGRIVRTEEEESQELKTLLTDRLRLENRCPMEAILRLCPSPGLLLKVASGIEMQARVWTNQEANRILVAKPRILEQLHPFLVEANMIEEENDDDSEPDDELDVSPPSPADSEAILNRRAADLLRATLRTCATSAAMGVSPRRRMREVMSVVEGLLPPAKTASRIGRRILLRRALMVLIAAPRSWVFNVAGSYSQFRRRHPALYVADVGDRDELISGDEMDVLILLSLRNAMTVKNEWSDGAPPSWLSPIIDYHYPQVYVDEATDFSAVQLAALMQLSHPNLRSWFACGDFRQRITLTGISSKSELRWIEKTCGAKSTIELKNVEIPYRQSERLREFSEAINPDIEILPDRTHSVYQDDTPPLLLEGANDSVASSWLALRVSEIEKALGALPSIAVFVNGDDRIEPTVKAALEPLRDRSIQIVGCPQGRIMGDAQEVRVFDVRHIKGLEFEAVFFIGLDDFAEVEPELFHRFFYVGVTRAATYLGITCRNKLPNRLEPVRSLFSDDGW